MATFSLRRLILGLLIFLHGVVTLCGSEMHRHGYAVERSQDAKREKKAFSVDFARFHSDCQGCRYLTQAQLVETPFDLRRSEVAVSRELSIDIPEPALFSAREHRPRAPPYI